MHIFSARCAYWEVSLDCFEVVNLCSKLVKCGASTRLEPEDVVESPQPFRQLRPVPVSARLLPRCNGDEHLRISDQPALEQTKSTKRAYSMLAPGQYCTINLTNVSSLFHYICVMLVFGRYYQAASYSASQTPWKTSLLSKLMRRKYYVIIWAK